MSFSFVTYTGDGVTTLYNVPFGYISTTHVKATVNGVDTSFTWASASSIQFAVAPAASAAIRIYRETPLTEKLVDFINGSTLVEADLDTISDQMLYAMQEAYDDVDTTLTKGVTGVEWGGEGLPIVNIGSITPAADSTHDLGTDAVRWREAFLDRLTARVAEVSSGDTGATPWGGADELTVESGGTGGISILTPAANSGCIVFGDPDNNLQFRMQYTHSADVFQLIHDSGEIARFSGDGRIQFGGLGLSPLGANAGSLTISTGDSGVSSPSASADDLVIESNGNAGINICTPNTAAGSIRFADPEGSSRGIIQYDHADDSMSLWSATSAIAYFLAAGGTHADSDSVRNVLSVPDGILKTERAYLFADNVFPLWVSRGNVSPAGGLLTVAQFASTSTTPNSGALNLRIDAESDNAAIQINGLGSFFITTGTTDYTDAFAAFGGAVNRIIFGDVTSDALGAQEGATTISTGDSGVTTPDATADDLIVEGGGDTGISILSPEANTSMLMFGGPSDLARGAAIRWQYGTAGATKRMIVGTRTPGAYLRLDANNAQERARITGNGFLVSANGDAVDIAGAEPGIVVSTGDSGVTTPNVSADDVVIENDGNCGITIATPNWASGQIRFADPTDDDAGMIYYDHFAQKLGIVATEAGATVEINGDAIILTGATVPASASDTGVAGQIAWDANYIYLCVAANTWKRVAISTW